MHSDQQSQKRLYTVTQRLIEASEKRSMHLRDDHPWDIAVTDQPILKKRERISIYGTPYWDLASEQERQRLAMEEVVTWWSGFIHLESLVIEYYMRVINNGAFRKLPYIEEYMKHFIKEEIVHTLVFKKAIDYYGSEIYEAPEFMRSFYDDNAGTGEYPLMAVYLTMVIEWMADQYQRMDLDAEYTHPLAKAVVHQHWKEEMRHIKWGQNMILGLANTDPEFQMRAQEMTPVYLRQLIDQGITNVECFDRIGFKHGAFQDHEKLLDAVLYNEHRRKLNEELTIPLMRYFVSAGIYDDKYKDLWVSQGFGEIVDMILRNEGSSQYDKIAQH